MEAARTEWTARREALADKIHNGTASRTTFYVWVQPDLEERRQRLLAQALDRQNRRASGEVLEIDDVQEAAAEFVSYLPGETLPEEVSWILRAAREQHPTIGTPGHQEWAEANALHWIVGPDGGKAMRGRLEVLVTSSMTEEVS